MALDEETSSESRLASGTHENSDDRPSASGTHGNKNVRSRRASSPPPSASRTHGGRDSGSRPAGLPARPPTPVRGYSQRVDEPRSPRSRRSRAYSPEPTPHYRNHVPEPRNQRFRNFAPESRRPRVGSHAAEPRNSESTSTRFGSRGAELRNQRPRDYESRGRVSKPKGAGGFRDQHTHLKKTIARMYVENGKAVSQLRETDRVEPPQAYHPGLIFSAPMHSQTDSEMVSIGEVNMTATTFGTVYSKYRKMVVLTMSKEGDSCTVLPIYSNNGKGLRNKRAKDEWMAIRDKADSNVQPSESCHKLIFAVRNESYGPANFISGTSNIHLTEAITHKFRNPVTFEGCLSQGMLPYLSGVAKEMNNERLDAWNEGFSSETS